MSAEKKRTPTKKKPATGRKSGADQQKVRVLLASVFLLAFVGLCLLLLVTLRKSYQPESQVEVEMPPAVVEIRQQYSYEQIYAMLEAELLSASQSKGWQKLPAEGALQRLKIFDDYPHHEQLEELSTRIAQTTAPAALDLLPRKGLVHLYWQGELRLELRYRVPFEVHGTRPKIAIIMDDMGRRVSTFDRLLAIDLMVTPAILPESENATKAALLLQKARREYMIHLPMQPKQYPQMSPGPNALLLGQSEEKTRQLVRRYMELVPGAVGGNNHMGSRYTEEAGPMRVLLDELQQNGLFFIDSKTIGSSVAYKEARKLGMPTAQRHIFLDNEEDVSYIRQQIRKMVRLADSKGELVAICHPYPETLEAFRQELSWLKQQSVDFVPSSAIVRTN
ncbi:MAG TPA: divergent polysaccharide deacetylase family protein [Malonomonas sp.]